MRVACSKQIFSIFSICLYLITGNINAQERPVRFVIASFVVDGGNDDLKRRLYNDFETQIFDVVDQCIEQMEFIPEAQGEAIEYLDNISTRFKRDYGIEDKPLPIPKRGNYIILVRIEPDNSGVYMQIGVFERKIDGLTYVGNGIAESELALNVFYQGANRREFTKNAIQDAFPRNKLISWIRKENDADLSDCFTTGNHSSSSSGSPSNSCDLSVPIVTKTLPPLKIEITCARLQGNDLILEFNLTNEGESQDITFTNGSHKKYLHVFDQYGKEYFISGMQMHDELLEFGGSVVTRHFVSGIPIPMKLFFSKVNPEINSLSKVYLKIGHFNQKKWPFEFEGIPVIK